MKKLDLSEELIENSKFYIPNSAYAGFFKRRNINTIEEVVNGTFEGNYFMGYHTNMRIIRNLKIFYSLLRNQYFDEPLVMDWYLDKSIDVKEYQEHPYSKSWLDLKPEINTEPRIIITSFFGLDDFTLGNVVWDFLKDKNPDEDVKVIDVLKYIANDEYLKPPYRAICEAYIAEYNRMIELGEEYASPEVISYLKVQLESLISSRDDLDKQISVLQNKIEYLSSKGSNGGVKL